MLAVTTAPTMAIATPMADQDPQLGRRGFLGAVLGGTAVVAGGAGFGIGRATSPGASSTSAGPTVAAKTRPFYGPHQGGIATRPPAHCAVAAYDVLSDIDLSRFGAAMGIVTDDLSRITQGAPALGDTAPMLAASPAGLSVTVGLGPGLLKRYGIPAPAGFTALEPFEPIDQLNPAYCDGDLVLVITSDDPLTVSHSLRMLTKDLRSFASIRWVQRGFHDAAPTDTPRNLFGQKDGTVNPAAESDDFDASVWINEGPWAGGTTLVVRRIRMEMDTWDTLDRSAMDEVVGRRLDTGAPLTGEHEHDIADLGATNKFGLPVIREGAHIRLARADTPQQQLLRRPYNYDDSSAESTDMGLIFLSYQANLAAQFIPVQQRLAESDLLNEWTTPVGSAVFAVLPGCAEGQVLGDGVLA